MTEVVVLVLSVLFIVAASIQFGVVVRQEPTLEAMGHTVWFGIFLWAFGMPAILDRTLTPLPAWIILLQLILLLVGVCFGYRQEGVRVARIEQRNEEFRAIAYGRHKVPPRR